jgi:hypothetical protein
MTPSKECAVCKIRTGELQKIGQGYVCRSCIANDEWYLKTATGRHASVQGWDFLSRLRVG